MSPWKRALPGVVCVSLAASSVWAQDTQGTNPQISFIGDVRARAFDATPDELSLELNEIEVAATGTLSPFARGDFFLGIHDAELEIEEAYVTFTSLPGGLSLRAGQWLAFVGRINRQHPHTFSFLDAPLLVTQYLGEEGFSGVGAQLSMLVDVGSVPLTLTGEVFNRGPGLGHGHEEDEEEHDEHDVDSAGRTLGDLTYNGRGAAFFTTGEFSWLEIGASAGTGLYDEAQNLRQIWYGADAKFKWKPSRYTSLSVVAEFMGNIYDAPLIEDPGVLATASELGTTKPAGFFASVDYQFARKWNVGALVDYAQQIDDPTRDQLGVGAYGGYALFEESTLIRLLARRDYVPEEKDPFSVQLQVVFSLGPHKPHTF